MNDSQSLSSRTDPAALASLAALWRSHCLAASELAALADGADAEEPGSWSPGSEKRAADGNLWRELGRSDAAMALFCQELDGGERLAALSAASPVFVRKFLFAQTGGSRPSFSITTLSYCKRPDRQLARARMLCGRLAQSMSSGSKTAATLFPSDPPFGHGGFSTLGAGMRSKRLAHIASILGPASLIPPAAASGIPLFGELAIGCACASLIASGLMIFGRTLEFRLAARAVGAAWPALSTPSIYALLDQNSVSGKSPIAEFVRAARPPLPGEEAALASLSIALFKEPAACLPEPARAYCMAALSACERQEISDGASLGSARAKGIRL